MILEGPMEDFYKKGARTLKRGGIRLFLSKTAYRIQKEVLGRTFYEFIFYTGYRRLWGKVFESYQVKRLPVFLIRFILVLLFGWIVIFVPKKPFLSVTPKQVKRWFLKNHKKVTVVIPTYNDYKLTKNCVKSIKKLPSGSLVDIVVVDDGSPSKIQTKLERLNLPARLILRTKNEGFAKACNVGINAVKSGDVVLLNNDTIVHDGWIDGLQYYAYLRSEVGITGPKLLYPDRTIQWAGSHRNLGAPEWFDHNYRFRPYNYGPASIPTEVLGVSGACMYIRRSVINKIGVFDPKFEMAFEDADYSIRAWNAGFKLLYVPVSVVTHHESKTRGKKQGAREMRSLHYFWEKWGGWFDGRKVTNSKGRLKIIYVMKDTGVAGGHKVVFEHINGLVESGYEAVVYALSQATTWFPLKAQVKTFRSFKLLEADLKEQEAIKVATWWETAPSVWRSSITKGIPVYFVQDIETSYYKESDPILNLVLAWYKKEFKYVTTSDWNKKRLAKLGLDAEIVSPAIDHSVFKLKNLKREADVLLAVGRSHPLKNLAFTVRAWKRLNKRPKLVLFGVEPSLGRKFGAEYIFAPDDPEVADLYNRATIFVQTSRHEGFCLTILEAMACGVPVICTDADGNMDFCVDRKNCIMVEQDNVAQLTQAMRELLTNKKLYDDLVKAGLETAATYTWKAKIRRLDKFYSKLGKQNSVNQS